MNIQILYNQDYIPFDLYIYSIKHILRNENVSIIRNILQLDSSADYLIIFINHYEQIYNASIPDKTKIIFIIADYLLNFREIQQQEIKKFINKYSEKTYLWEYSPLNIMYYKNNEIACNVNFIPLLYSDFLEKTYRKYTKYIPYDEKPIDVLFVINGMQERRIKIMNGLKNKCKMYILSGVDNIEQYCLAVESSKMIVNVFSKEINRAFDYYRLALLYANRILVINEAVKHHDFSIQKHLVELNDVIISVEYDDIIDTVCKYLKKTSQEIEEITEKTYQVFTKYAMQNYVINFFESQQKT